MALIERNKDLPDNFQSANNLVIALLLIGVSMGLLTGAILSRKLPPPNTEPVIIYLISVSFFAGLALLLANMIKQKKGRRI